jgi:Nucleotidyltransferase/DNA polymerase involved in DNA repair
MDAFYASIEQRDNPGFRGKPVAVGYAGLRGVVAAASYEARKFGVHSAMPSQTALKKCPHLIFTPTRFDVYESVSGQIHAIFHEYTDLVEPLSLDEAFLDVTVNKKNMPSATLIAKEIKARIKEVTGLTASAGVSNNKFLAKIASDFNKPDGLFTVRPDEAEKFVEQLKIERFFGVGKVTATKMHTMGIYTGADLKQFSEEELYTHFGKAGYSYYLYARGIDNREVEAERIRKSVGAENTFGEDIGDIERLLEELHEIRDTLWERIEENEFVGRTLTLKVKYADFRQITRSVTPIHPFADKELLTGYSEDLLKSIDMTLKKVRLLGLSVSNAMMENSAYIQLEIPFDWDY